METLYKYEDWEVYRTSCNSSAYTGIQHHDCCGGGMINVNMDGILNSICFKCHRKVPNEVKLVLYMLGMPVVGTLYTSYDLYMIRLAYPDKTIEGICPYLCI